MVGGFGRGMQVRCFGGWARGCSLKPTEHPVEKHGSKTALLSVGGNGGGKYGTEQLVVPYFPPGWSVALGEECCEKGARFSPGASKVYEGARWSPGASKVYEGCSIEPRGLESV